MSPSFAQTYCCLRREPHFLCSILNETLALDSDDEYRFTGTETRPNEIVAAAIGRAGIRAREYGNGSSVPESSVARGAHGKCRRRTAASRQPQHLPRQAI